MTTNSMPRLWHIELSTEVKIDGCPTTITEAIDWRRAHGLPERHDERQPLSWSGDDEESFRAALADGASPTRYANGGATIDARDSEGYSAFGPAREGSYGYYHGSSYGWRAAIPVDIVRAHVNDPSAASAAAVILAIRQVSREHREVLQREAKEREEKARAEKEAVAERERGNEAIVRAWLRYNVPALERLVRNDAPMHEIRRAAGDLVQPDNAE